MIVFFFFLIKWTAYPIKGLNQIGPQECLFDYFSILPIPKIIQMGNSREIDNAGVQDFLNLYNVEPYFVTPGHCDSRGSLE